MFTKIRQLLSRKNIESQRDAPLHHSKRTPSPADEPLDKLEQQWELLSSKRLVLYEEYLFESRPDEQFRLQNALDRIEAGQNEISSLLKESAPEKKRQEFETKQQQLILKLKKIELEYEQIKNQARTASHLTEIQEKERIRLMHVIERTEREYKNIEGELKQLSSQAQDAEELPSGLQQQIMDLEANLDLLNNKLKYLRQQ
ncbi:MAG: hypothetical protein Q3M24_13905 [Candidatus Electrothrix aestuarii]|uniref:Uncharacterized protein n=1 Tax=Candidatus Electrothrix aestuarii TaxID=3062594 RepID=A0AAU8LQT5_9BACT|nr:hypothetical protein [Candidatus Electrothrix aestuarii]